MRVIIVTKMGLDVGYLMLDVYQVFAKLWHSIFLQIFIFHIFSLFN
jgi:hypothetical protein